MLSITSISTDVIRTLLINLSADAYFARAVALMQGPFSRPQNIS